MTVIKNLGWLLLLVLAMPLLMAFGLGAGAVILWRSLYRWARGNTTETSRVPLPASSDTGR